MKATVEPTALAAACKLTGAAINTKATMPVLSGVHVVPCDAGLRLSTFDLETSVQTVVRTETPPSGDPVLVSHRLLAQVAAVAGKKPLAVTKDRSKLVATSGKSEWRMPLMPEEDFPKLPAMPDPLGKVDAGELADAIRNVSLAASRDETLPMLTGVHITFEGDQLILACTDRYRLHTATVTWSPEVDTSHKPVLVPARSIRTVAGFSHGTAELFAGGNLFAIAVHDTRFTTRLLDMQFPAWQSLIPERGTAGTRASVEPEHLLDAVRQVAVGAGDTVPLRVTFREGGGISMEARDDDDNVVGTAEIDALIEGDEITAAINHVYLSDALATIAGTVEINLTTSTKPVGFGRPDQKAEVVVVPVRVAG